VSWGLVTKNTIGNITLNDDVVLETLWTSNSVYRGFNIVELAVGNCSVSSNSSYHQFDTCGDGLESESMAKYITALPKSTVLVGVTADDAQSQLCSRPSAINALLSIGVNVTGLVYNGKISFVAQVGQPSATLMKLGGKSADVLVLTAAVRRKYYYLRPSESGDIDLDGDIVLVQYIRIRVNSKYQFSATC